MTTIKALIEGVSDGLTHAEALTITGITGARILNWYRTITLPSTFAVAPGRGNRRRYDFGDIVRLTAIRVLADSGISFKYIGELSEKLDMAISCCLVLAWDLAPESISEWIREYPESWIAIMECRDTSQPGDKSNEMTSTYPRYFAADLDDMKSVKAIGDRAREFGAASFMMIDTSVLVVNLVRGLKKVTDARLTKAARKRRLA